MKNRWYWGKGWVVSGNKRNTCGWVGYGIAGFECIRARCIFWLRKPTLCPGLLRYFVSTLQRNSYVSLEEHIRRILRARLNGKARLVCKRQPYEPSEANTAFPRRRARIARRGEEKDSREMPCLPRLAHKAHVMQASKGRHDERKRYWCLSVSLVLNNSFNDTVIEEHLDVEKGEKFACMSS